MIEGTIFMLGLGTVCGLVLGAASRIFYVYEDPRIAQVESCFAGANCGGCGYAGCAAAAVAVVAGEALPSVCIVGGGGVRPTDCGGYGNGSRSGGTAEIL